MAISCSGNDAGPEGEVDSDTQAGEAGQAAAETAGTAGTAGTMDGPEAGEGGAAQGGSGSSVGAASGDAGASNAEAGAGGGGAELPIFEGNIEADDLPDHGSVGFVLVDDTYALFKKEGAEDTSISRIADDGRTAYGWYRIKPIDDPASVDVAFRLDLATGEFFDIPFEDSRAAIVRGGYGTKLVGKMIFMNQTPEDRTDDFRRGFVYDVVTEELELIERPGFDDIGFTAMNVDGLITGFNDFGELGFVYDHGTFTDLTNDGAFRLFPFAINADSTIVGAWGATEDDWYEETRGSGFVATPDPVKGFRSEEVTFPGYVAGYLTGINDAGAFAATGFKTANSYRVLLRGESLDAVPESVPFAKDYEPFPTGIGSTGIIFGQAMAVAVKKDCAGHGLPDGGSCICDDDYELDPYDANNCIAIGAVCNGHGHEHEVGECHCDSGFKNPIGDKSQCVPS